MVYTFNGKSERAESSVSSAIYIEFVLRGDLQVPTPNSIAVLRTSKDALITNRYTNFLNV